jgi:hypothetical protein
MDHYTAVEGKGLMWQVTLIVALGFQHIPQLQDNKGVLSFAIEIWHKINKG